ncbi:MAG: 23S rRNA (uracil(1939)-C(5))-methyltransferase RlmD [Oscillospiraceae bacterium]|jgi:23S rRNA (uracil1939-C5)-methyltransferase|nr:23S rRNA (uracil(1939)-C(5))-methyltransferase RlmD [Oscillospiraceae bacterium]
MMKKNDIVTLAITSANSDGQGVARAESGEVIFVANAIPGENVSARVLKVGKSSAWAKSIEVLSASPERITTECPYYPKCGGCSYLHMSYAEELRQKLERVNDAFQRIGGLELRAERIIPSIRRFGYRNKAIFNFAVNPSGGSLLGFYRANSHDVIPVDNCLLQSEFANNAANALNSWAKENGISIYDESSGKGLLRKLFTRGTQVCVVANGKPRLVGELIDEVRSAVPECTSLMWNEQRGTTNVVFGEKFHLLFGSETVTINGTELSPDSFYQVNSEQAERLYEIALEFADLRSVETALDLYCGVGTLTLLIAAKAAKVTGVEINPSAIAGASLNAKRNKVTNADFVHSDVSVAELPAADCVFVDPPRKGLSAELIENLTALSPKRIAYISCDPATLARDLKLLNQRGYRAVRAEAVDMFPGTAHVETVVEINRQ